MPKTDLTFDPNGYAPVAERIRLFYAAHPLGRIVTKLVSDVDGKVVFKALVYRDATDERAAATGWAAEREGDGDINSVACLENTETSAIGRALANLGFTASRQRPSAEEMEKAARFRARIASERHTPPPNLRPLLTAVREGAPSERRQRLASEVLDALTLLRAAERAGLRAQRVEGIRQLLARGHPAEDEVRGWSRLLRRWIE